MSAPPQSRPEISPPPSRAGLRRYTAAKLLIALGLLFAVTPFVEALKNGDLIEAVLVTVVLMSAVLAVGGRRRTLVLAIALMTPAVVGKWINHYWPDLCPPEIFLTVGLVFVAFVVTHLLTSVLRAPRVNSEVLCAGIATYLLMGMLWVLAYTLVGRMNPNAFAFSTGPNDSHTMTGFNAFYFSFTTLSTAGYGDITPVSNGARMLAVTEMIAGVLYVAVLIARLVALHATSGPSDPPDDSNKP
jgi:hypothetical protein